MVRIERFVREYGIDRVSINGYNPDDRIPEWSTVIYDRVKKREIAKFNTGDEFLDEKLAEQVITMLNIEFIGESE